MHSPSRAGVVLAIAIAAGAVALVQSRGSSSSPDPPRSEAGRVHLFKEGDSRFARWVHRGDCRRFLARYHRMRLYQPDADRCVRGGYHRGLAYLDAQAIYPWELRRARRESARTRRAKRALARMILRDSRGRRLYVPYDCDGRRCPQFAADIGRRAWRTRLSRAVGRALRRGYRGVFLDDVNWNVNTSDGRERAVAPVHPVTGARIELDTWRRALARLLRGVRADHPRAEIMINSVWWKPEHALSNPHVARGVSAADAYELERGTLDTFRGQSYGALLGAIDRLHALGLGVNLDNYEARTRRQAEFELGTYFLVSEGRDSLAADFGSCPSASGSSPCEEPFWEGYRTDLGEPRGARSVRPDGLLERRFERGIVLVNPPRAPLRAARVDGGPVDLDGRRAGRVVLAGGEARVLRD